MTKIMVFETIHMKEIKVNKMQIQMTLQYFKCQYCGYFSKNISDAVKEYTEIQTHELKCSKNMFNVEVLKNFADKILH